MTAQRCNYKAVVGADEASQTLKEGACFLSYGHAGQHQYEIGIWLREYHFARWSVRTSLALVAPVAKALPRYVIAADGYFDANGRCALLRRTPATEAICNAIYEDAPAIEQSPAPDVRS